MNQPRRYFRFHYDLLNQAGEIIDSSRQGAPLDFVEGDRRIIPGLQKALQGRQPGDRFRVRIPPEEAYGLAQRSLIRTVSRESFDPGVELRPGKPVQSGTGEQAQVYRVVEVSDDSVTLDGNHPLAGVTLDFQIEVIEVREANLFELPAK